MALTPPGRAQVTDSDSGPGADPAGRGRGGGSHQQGPARTGITDSDGGAYADPVGNGRGGGQRPGGSTRTGITDSDSGAYADPAGNGRGGGGRPQTTADSDNADRSGYGRGNNQRNPDAELECRELQRRIRRVRDEIENLGLSIRRLRATANFIEGDAASTPEERLNERYPIYRQRMNALGFSTGPVDSPAAMARMLTERAEQQDFEQYRLTQTLAQLRMSLAPYNCVEN
ncbi:hypothetical protein [Sphingosinicella sp.]|uniref:hypothetical protein n=1 Tax=Sphingosinicella sp. TaxID=1917971 RepID=UPI004038326C